MSRARGVVRSRVIAMIAVLAVVVGGGIVVSQYRAAQASISSSRASLHQAQAAERAASRALAAARAATRALDAQVGADRGSIAADGRAITAEQVRLGQIAAAMHTIARLNVEVHARITESVKARVLLAGAAATVAGCLHFEQRAMVAIAAGDDAGAKAALNQGSAPCATALAAASGARFPYDFPDPFVLRVKDGYLAYSTNANGGTVQVIHSNDLLAWTIVGDALAAVPTWARPGYTWGPSVLHLAALAPAGTTPGHSDEYVLYYTVHQASTGAQCISSAVASDPVGPFVDDSTGPLVCDVVDGGSIDPSPFVDNDGRMWLMWKRERAFRPAAIVSQQLGPDGRSLVGAPVDLLTADQGWERGVVESPSMVRVGDHFWLFVSGGIWNERSYAEGVASCDGPTGPCRPANRLLGTAGSVVSPGGGAVFTAADGSLWLAYHAYTDPFVGWPYSRTFRLARVHVDTDTVRITPE